VEVRLKEWRLRKALTQQELADKAGTTKANISRIEAGDQLPRPATVRKLATALGITTEELIRWDTNGDRPIA
jgi:transcriptional regulator with XRE-family HTH domain